MDGRSVAVVNLWRTTGSGWRMVVAVGGWPVAMNGDWRHVALGGDRDILVFLL